MRVNRLVASLTFLVMIALAASAWPGTYSGSRIMGGADVCAVYSERTDRLRDGEFGIYHLYAGDYTTDYLRACYPKFLIAGRWEDARGVAGAARPADALRITAGSIESEASFESMADSNIVITTQTYSTPSGVIVFSISILNKGFARAEVLLRPVASPRLGHRAVNAWDAMRGYASLEFDSARIDIGFIDDEMISSGRRSGSSPESPAVGSDESDFPGIEMPMVISPRSMVQTGFFVRTVARGDSAATANSAPPTGLSLDEARAAWLHRIDSHRLPPLADTALNRAFTAALVATAATSLRGAVPADMTGQFVTDGRPQLYPRDALMTARMLFEAGQTDMAAEIVRFWNASIPQKTPGEWYARYDAFAAATPGGSGAAYDEPEWDSNGYYTTLVLRLYARTGVWHGDYTLVKSLLDFIITRQDADGLLTEGGIVEWTGRLPATNMNVAAGLRHGAILCEMRGDSASALRYRAAAARMEDGLDRLFSRARGAYMDMRAGKEQFNTSADFGYVWEYPDHLELAMTNAWYRDNAYKLGAGVQYFDAEGYGDDCFGFTTGASARYHAEVGAPETFKDHLEWMMARSNVYGMMPERVHYPGGADVSEASPLSWCNAEFVAAVLAGARVGDPFIGAGAEFALSSLEEELGEFARIVSAICDAGTSSGELRRLVDASAAAARGTSERRRSNEERLRALLAAVAGIESELGVARTDTVRDDLRLLAARLRARVDRLLWNVSGASVEATLSSRAAVLGESIEMTVRPRGTDIEWKRAIVELKDGNERTVERELTSSAAAFSTTIAFSRGTPPYATAARATVFGEWKGMPVRMSRTLACAILPECEIEAMEESGGISARVRTHGPDANRALRFECPSGWRYDEAPSESGARRFLFSHADAPPGIYAFTLVSPSGARFDFSSGYRSTLPLEGTWKFRLGDDASWASPELDDAAWETIKVPASWESAGHPGYDGWAWYRISVDVPENWRGMDLRLVLGAVDDEDWTYWNGAEIGHVSVWNERRAYTIAASTVKYGERNVIAVRVKDGMYDGGIWLAPVKLELLPKP